MDEEKSQNTQHMKPPEEPHFSIIINSVNLLKDSRGELLRKITLLETKNEQLERDNGKLHKSLEIFVRQSNKFITRLEKTINEQKEELDSLKQKTQLTPKIKKEKTVAVILQGKHNLVCFDEDQPSSDDQSINLLSQYQYGHENEKFQALLHKAQKDAQNKLDDIVWKSTDPDDCVENMGKIVDNFVKDYVANDDFFKGRIPEDDVEEVKAELEPLFRDAFKDMEADKLKDLLEACQGYLMKEKGRVILDSVDEKDCVCKMADDVEDFAKDYIKRDNFFKSIPEEIVGQLTDEYDPIFRDEYRLKEEKKLQQLMKAVRKMALAEQDIIVLQSEDVENCVDKTRTFVDECVEEFAGADDFFKEIPHRASDKIKSELEPIFRSAFENMKDAKLEELIAITKRHTLDSLDNIVCQSIDVEDCMHRMEGCVDDMALAFVETDDFLNEVPERELMHLKRLLEPIFKEAYDSMKNEYVGNLINNVEHNIRDCLDNIVDKSKNVDDCVDKMNLSIDDFADDFIKKASVKLNPPEGELDDLKEKLKPVFIDAFEDKKFGKIKELLDDVKQVVLNSQDRVIDQSSSSEDCVEKANKLANQYAQTFVRKSDWLREVPEAELEELKKELEPLFKNGYEDKHKSKVKELLDAVKENVLDQKNEIVAKSKYPEDCEKLMNKAVDSASGKFLFNDDFLKSFPKEDMNKLKQKLKPFFLDSYNEKVALEELEKERTQKIQDLLDDAKFVMEAKKDNIVEEAEDLEQCLSMMDNMLMEFAQEFAANERLLDEIPEEGIEDLKNQLESGFIHAYESRKREKEIEKLRRNKEKLLLDNAKRLVYNKVEEITATSDNDEEAVEKMKKLVDKYANQFVVKDDVMDEVPVEALNNLKKELEPVILKHWQIQKRRKQAMKENKIKQLVAETKENMLENLDDIVHQSNDMEDCISFLHAGVDDFVEDFVENDDILTEIPVKHIDELKVELEPIFVNAMEEHIKRLAWEEENRALLEAKEIHLNEMLGIRVKLMFNSSKANVITVPMRRGGKVYQLKQYMIDMFGYEEEDPMSVKKGKKRVSWDDTLDELCIEEGSKLKLWLPEAKGRQKVFIRLDIKKQRVLHKHDFPKALQTIGISIGAAALEKVWELLDTEKQDRLSYKQFQNIISPEADIREFTKMIPLIAHTPMDEFEAFRRTDLVTKREYLLAVSQIITDDARLQRLNNASDIHSLFGAFDAYMEGRINLPLFRTGLEVAGLILNEVHMHILFQRMTSTLSRQSLNIEDFLRVHPKIECTIDEFLQTVNNLFYDLQEPEYRSMERRIYNKKGDQAKNEAAYQKSKRKPREVLGLD